MNIRQENPPAKPTVATLKPSTTQLYKKVQRKLRKSKQAKKGQTSGDASGAVPGMQAETAPDPTIPRSTLGTKRREEQKSVPTTQPAASVAAGVHSQDKETEESEKPTGAEGETREVESENLETESVEDLGVEDEKAEEVDTVEENVMEGEALEKMEVDRGQEAKTTGVEAEQKPANVSPTRPQEQPEVVIVDDTVSSPERAPPMTRRQIVSRCLYEIETEKEKLREAELEQPRRRPRIKRAHTSAEIAEFDKKKAASESAAAEEKDGTEDETAKETDEAERNRERKGKQVAEEPSKKARSSRPMTRQRRAVEIQEPIKVPFAPEEEEDEEKKSLEGSESSNKSEVEEVPIYHQALVDVDNNLLEQMREFPTEKLRKDHEKRSADTQSMKSGRRYHPAALQEIGLEDKVRQYIAAIGFEWLLDHEDERVPDVLALEFFTTL